MYGKPTQVARDCGTIMSFLLQQDHSSPYFRTTSSSSSSRSSWKVRATDSGRLVPVDQTGRTDRTEIRPERMTRRPSTTGSSGGETKWLKPATCYFSLYTDYNWYSTITTRLCLRSKAKEMHNVRFNLSVILWKEARVQAGIEPRSFTSQVQWTTWPLDPALPRKLNIFIWLESRTYQGPFWQYINNLSSP